MTNTTLSRYLWKFFALFLFGYLIGLALIFAVDAHWHTPILRDIFVLALLSALLPLYISGQFVKNEGRFFTVEEQKSLVSKTTLIAFFISMLPTAVFIILKLWTHSFNVTLGHFLGALLINTLFYYGALRLMIHFRFKRTRRRYEQKQSTAQHAVNDGQFE